MTPLKTISFLQFHTSTKSQPKKPPRERFKLNPTKRIQNTKTISKVPEKAALSMSSQSQNFLHQRDVIGQKTNKCPASSSSKAKKGNKHEVYPPKSSFSSNSPLLAFY